MCGCDTVTSGSLYMAAKPRKSRHVARPRKDRPHPMPSSTKSTGCVVIRKRPIDLAACVLPTARATSRPSPRQTRSAPADGAATDPRTKYSHLASARAPKRGRGTCTPRTDRSGSSRKAVAARAFVVGSHIDRTRGTALDDLSLDAHAPQRAVIQRGGNGRPGLSVGDAHRWTSLGR